MTPSPLIMEATRRLVENFHPAKVILFGSRARGTATEESDADFLVLCDRVDNKFRLMGEMQQAMRGLGIATDIVVMTPAEFEFEKTMPDSVARPISREGRVVYERAA